MKHKLAAILGLFGFVITTIVIFAALFKAIDLRDDSDKNHIVIGSKADTEGLVLAEIMARLIERSAGARVIRRTHLGGTHICFRALLAGEIDLYPEYTGTALMAILDQPLETDPKRTFAIVREQLAQKHHLLLLEPLAFNNSYALAMRESQAEHLDIRSISDLAKHTGLRAGFTAEFLARRDGYPGLLRRYGLGFEKEPAAMEAGLMYGALERAEIDVIGAYATDGRIEKMRLRVLSDDLDFFPPYQAAPLLRTSDVARTESIVRALRVLGGRLSDAEMRRLNAAVDIERRTPEEVAEKYVAGLFNSRR